MKHLIFVFSLLGLVSCSSCTTKTDVVSGPTTVPSCTDSACPIPSSPTTTSVTPPPLSSDQELFKGEDDSWQFLVPKGWVKQTTDDPSTKLELMNVQKRNLILFIQESFTGTGDEYTIEVLRGIKSQGAKLNSATPVTVNGENFVLIDSIKSNIRLWIWSTVKNKMGQSLSCGGVDTSENHDICFTVAQSLQIK